MTVDRPRVEAAVREILAAIGEDPDRDGLTDTPARVARMYAEVFEGLDQDAHEPLSTAFDLEHQELVLVRDIPFHSMCEHHLLPFMRITTQVADALMRDLGAAGAIVVLEAEHMCMSMRGVRAAGASTVTSAVRGILRQEATRLEAMTLILRGAR